MMNAPLSLFAMQGNVTVGDIAGNCARIRDAYAQAAAQGAELMVTSELCVTGYPPEDLLLSRAFVDAAMESTHALADLTAHAGSPALLVGTLWRDATGKLFNASVLFDGGKLVTVRYKHDLPNFGVFDEQRYFAAGPLPHVISWRGRKLGVMICEDMWHPEVANHLAAQGAECFIVLNASPYERNKFTTRTQLAQQHCAAHQRPLYYINQVGGQDELVFDGASFAMNAAGECTTLFPSFEEHSALLTLSPATNTTHPDSLHTDYQAMVMGLRDYVEKNRFNGVLIGLSGGIDSALTAVIAVDAVGKDRVHLVMLPSPYTSQISLDDAAQLAQNLGTRYDILPIEDGMRSMNTMLAQLHDDTIPCAIAKENIQSRLRANLLMAISNSTGALLITTGNKSEMAVGYATLYGDMCGAYNPLKDLYKTEVFAISNWCNRDREIIPERIISRPPSAELRDDQKDEDSLPPYAILDQILYGLVDARRSTADLITEGFDEATVQRVARLLTISEYKRSQAPIGTKLSGLAFGRDRRFPITHRFKL